MSNKPLVTIGIPSYNHAQFLPEAIESALSQTYSNIEIVIVDDGSTDNSLEIARGYAAKHSIIKLHTHPNNENRGISATADLTIKLAKGKYRTTCCSDDVLYPDNVEQCVNYLEEHPDISFVYGYMDPIGINGEKLPYQLGTDISNEEDQLEVLLKSNPITAPSMMVRIEAFRRLGGHERDLIYSDWELWIRAASLYRFGFIPKPLVKYRIHNYNTSVVQDHLIHYSRMREMYLVLQEKMKKDSGKLGEEKYRRILDEQLKALPAKEARVILDKYYTALAERNFSAAVMFLKKAVQVSPRTTLRPRRIASIFKQAVKGLTKF